MLTKFPRGWELPESSATPEHVFHDRRRLLKGAAAGTILAGTVPLLGACDDAEETAALDEAAMRPDPSGHLYPVKRNPRYVLDRPITKESYAVSYNNYYEFGSSKGILKKAQRLPIRPWTVAIDGMVEKPMQIDIDTLLSRMPLEERLYRHRCVEAWSMSVPWSGFALKALVDMARPLSSAKYLKMVTFHMPKVAPGQDSGWYPWPYVEGLTLAEATNELAFIATGVYGKPIPKQNGAPLRLAVPWKYGFKSIKGIVQFTFTDKQPKSFWQIVQGREYGFWANVNPKVPHPRWSQATERVLGTNSRVPTLPYNGYEIYVASLYAGMQGKKIFF